MATMQSQSLFADREPPEPCNIVIFGATGDLTKRKLIPALVRMLRSRLIHPESHIIGVARDITADAWREMMDDGLRTYAPELDVSQDDRRHFASLLQLVTGDLGDDSTYSELNEALRSNGAKTNAVFYLAIPPDWYSPVAQALQRSGLSDQSKGYRRIVIEKPFGMDWHSANALNGELQKVFCESQIYRIDHYLGKESVQNLLVFRFANSILEPLWNRNFVDHVQVTVTESLGVEYRAGYYEGAGALRDMIQSHLMQVMTLVAMEAPTTFTADAVRDEKVKVLRAVRAIQPEEVDGIAVGAQYGSGTVAGETVRAYCTEPAVPADSCTETFAAVRFYVDNWRWHGVPFVLCTGKRLPERASEVVIRFRSPPQNFFERGAATPIANELVFRLQPDEGMQLRMNAKMPGLTTQLQRLGMHAPYSSEVGEMHEAYEILLHDVLLGDATLFSRADEIEESWKIVAPLLDAWKRRISIKRYRAGTWDVPDVNRVFEGCVGGWHKPAGYQTN